MSRSKLTKEEARFYKSTEEENESHVDYGMIEVCLFAAVFVLPFLIWLIAIGINNRWL